MKRKRLFLPVLTLALSIWFTLPVKADVPDTKISSEQEIPSAYASDFSEKDYKEFEEAAVVLRKNLINRKTSFSVNVKSDSNDVNALFTQLLERAYAENFSSPEAGDYLRDSISGAGASVSYYILEGSDLKYYTFKMQFTYYANASQEKYVTSNVKKIVSKLGLAGKADDVKIKAVYDYVTAHVKYDNDALSGNKPLAHSAYSAIADGKAVCQGYAGLVYRLMREADIPVRIITGKSKGQNHAWNIVKLSGKWYNLDATWDSTLSGGNDKKYQYFLKSTADFEDHKRDSAYGTSAFNKAHPMSGTSYSKYQPLISQVKDVKTSAVSATALKLTWTKQAKAHGYKVYVYYTSDKKYHLKATVKTNSAAIKNLNSGRSYQFVVRAYRDNYGEAALSAPAVFYTNPAATAISGLTTNAKSITASWKKVSPCAGYQLQYSKSSKFPSSSTKATYITKNSTISKKVTNLSAGTNYYFRVRPYILVNNKKQFGTWSPVKSVKCK